MRANLSRDPFQENIPKLHMIFEGDNILGICDRSFFAFKKKKKGKENISSAEFPEEICLL